MRTTFNTQLAVAGVDPRTAMAAMRVSSLELVLKTYADEKHLDVTKAVNLLPATPPMLEAVGSTPPSSAVVPIVVPTSGNGGALEGSAGPRSPAGEKSARTNKPAGGRPSPKAARAMDGRAAVTRAGEGTRTLDIQLGKP